MNYHTNITGILQVALCFYDSLQLNAQYIISATGGLHEWHVGGLAY